MFSVTFFFFVREKYESFSTVNWIICFEYNDVYYQNVCQKGQERWDRMWCSVYVFLFSLQFVAISDLKVILISNRKLPGLLVHCQTYFGSTREIMLKCLFPRVNYCGIAAKNIRQKYIIQQIYINNPGNIRGLSHFRHTIKCNEHIHSRYFHTEYIWYFYSSSPHNDSIFLNCICWI